MCVPVQKRGRPNRCRTLRSVPKIQCRSHGPVGESPGTSAYNGAAVLCPLCGSRNSRRACPALGQRICSVCCGTKRLTAIRCPNDCTYLASAREHPPSIVVRQQERDVGLFVHFTRDFGRRQSELFLVIGAFIAQYQPPELQRLLDADVEDAAGALASTFETASRGVIYEHRPQSGSAERLAMAIRPLLSEAAAGRGGTAFERDAAVVLRRVADAAGEMRRLHPGSQQAFIDFLARVVSKGTSANADKLESEGPRLILP